MKDLHSHILMNIDDGSKDLKSSLAILKKAQEENVTDIILTPHYIKNSNYAANNRKKLELLEILKEEARKNEININLYLGNEVYIDNGILSLIEQGEIATLNQSRYILIELPFMNKLQNLKEIIFELIRHNYIPIIAHPERYQYVQDNPLELQEYLYMGVLFQGNCKSLLGSYGKTAKKTLKILLKNNMIHFLASDIHKKEDNYNLEKVNKKLLKIVKDKQTVLNLLDRNFDKVIHDEEISI